MESKTYVFNPENGASGTGGNDGILAMLPALMQRQGVDPGLIALMNNRGNGGWDDMFAILLLFIIMGNGGWGGFGGNRCMGNGTGGVMPMINNDANTAVIMQSVQRNGYDIQTLATAMNTSSDAIIAAINGLGQQVCGLGNTVGMTANQILTAIMQGNNALATQLAECCCKTNNAITAMDGNIKLSICEQTHAINDTANSNALMLRDTNQANHQAVMAKLDQMQTQALQDKIDKLREDRSTLLAQISNEHQTQSLQAYQAQTVAPISAALAALQAEVAGIKCKLPNTVAVPYPQLKTYNPEVFQAAAMGAYAGDVAAARSTVGCGC